LKVQSLNFKLQTSNLGLRNSKGVALIMVLWVIAILSVVALEFCFAMRTEVNITKNFKEELQFYAMAQGEVQRAVTELIYRHEPSVQQMRKTLKPEEVPPEKREWITDGRPYTLSFDQGKGEIRIMGEAGKVNINLVSDKLLRKIIGQFGLEGEARDVVVDSIQDWRDPGELHRINGAKNEYYQSLKEPYNCKNGKLDTIEELLLVRGVTRELFYGKEVRKGEGGEKVEKTGLKDIFSIYSAGDQVDINSAPSPVLRFVLGVPIEVAQNIVKGRQEKNFENVQDLLQRVPDLSPFMADIGGLILFQSMLPYYTIEARAKNNEGRTVQGLKVIVKIDRTEKMGYKVIQWVDALF